MRSIVSRRPRAIVNGDAELVEVGAGADDSGVADGEGLVDGADVGSARTVSRPKAPATINVQIAMATHFMVRAIRFRIGDAFIRRLERSRARNDGAELCESLAHDVDVTSGLALIGPGRIVTEGDVRDAIMIFKPKFGMRRERAGLSPRICLNERKDEVNRGASSCFISFVLLYLGAFHKSSMRKRGAAMSQQGPIPGAARTGTMPEREGDRELVVARTFDAPPSVVFQAWSQPELFKRWWVPKSASGVFLTSCDMDVRTGGTYRLEFTAGNAKSATYYGKYLEVLPNERIVWTNDESTDGAVTTVTFEDRGGRTVLNFHERYPSKEAREEALEGSAAGIPEQFDQLDELLSHSGA